MEFVTSHDVDANNGVTAGIS